MLPPKSFPQNIRELHFEEIDSTHIYAVKHCEEFIGTTIITADFQTGGRGRLGRIWLSPKKTALLITIILRNSLQWASAPEVSLVFSLAVADFLRQIHLDSEVGWPNDIFVRDKKIAGILAEALVTSSAITGLVLSVGLNVNQTWEQLEQIGSPATSIRAELNRPQDVNAIKEALLAGFWPLYAKFARHGFGQFVGDYNKRLRIIDKKIVVDYGNRRDMGWARGVDERGNLILEMAGGEKKTCSAGEVVKIYN